VHRDSLYSHIPALSLKDNIAFGEQASPGLHQHTYRQFIVNIKNRLFALWGNSFLQAVLPNRWITVKPKNFPFAPEQTNLKSAYAVFLDCPAYYC
jgi:hypothetical protein